MTEPSAEDHRLAEVSESVRRLLDGGYEMLDLAQLTRRDPFLVDGRGQLWRPERGDPLDGRHPREWSFGLNERMEVVWLRRSERPAAELELDQREARARKASKDQLAEEHRRREQRRKHPPLRTLTLGDEERALGKATLRELARRLESAGGCLVVEKDGGLTVRVSSVSENTIRLGGALTRASATILACVKHRSGAVDPEELPDAQLTLGGDLLPPKLLGHGEVEQR